MKRSLIAGLLLVSAPAIAGGPCGGYFTSQWVPQPVLHPQGGVFIDLPRSSGGFGGGGGGDALGGMNDAKALLIVAVVAVAALPLFLYSIDGPATEDVMQCWASPSETFHLYSGGVGGGGFGTAYLGGRGAFSMGWFAAEASGESNPFWYHDVGGAFGLRAPPRQHVELSLMVGVRQIMDRSGAQSWLEFSLPHRYLPFRVDAFDSGVSLELRPALLWAPGALDGRLDASVVVPFARWSTVAVGVRAYSFGSAIRVGAQLGFTLNV